MQPMRFSKDGYYFKYSTVYCNIIEQYWANHQNNNMQMVRNLGKSI